MQKKKKKNLELEDVAMGKNSSRSYRDPASTHSTLVCSQLPLTAAPGDCSVSISLTVSHCISTMTALVMLSCPLPLLLISFCFPTNPLLLPSLFSGFCFCVIAQRVSFLLFTRAQERICSQKHAWCEWGTVLTGSGSEHLVPHQGHYFRGCLL